MTIFAVLCYFQVIVYVVLYIEHYIPAHEFLEVI